jgi:hypothetical protein
MLFEIQNKRISLWNGPLLKNQVSAWVTFALGWRDVPVDIAYLAEKLREKNHSKISCGKTDWV